LFCPRVTFFADAHHHIVEITRKTMSAQSLRVRHQHREAMRHGDYIALMRATGKYEMSARCGAIRHHTLIIR